MNIIKNFIKKDEINLIVDFLNSDKAEEGFKKSETEDDNIWSGRILPVFNHGHNVPVEIQELLFEKYKEIRNHISSTSEKDVMCDGTFNFARWRVGDIQHPHIDACPGLEWRDFGCVLYLNEEYEGGEIYFPQHKIEMKPEPGTLVYFPGDDTHIHGVKEITDGTRHTLASFWTFDRTKGRSIDI